MKTEELKLRYESRKHPNEIFALHDEFLKLSKKEQSKFRLMLGRDQLSMEYITAVEMKKKGTWEKYVKKWEENRKKTGRDLLKEYMSERGLELCGSKDLWADKDNL